MDLIKQYLDQIDLDSNEKQSDELIIKNLVEELLTNIDRTNDQKFKSEGKLKRIRNEEEIIISSDESSSSSEEEPEHELDLSDAESCDEELDKCLTRFRPLKTKGELLLEELPPPEEDIQLTMNVCELQQIGYVCKILDNLLIVESFKYLPALDLDSILFFKTGLSIGRVFDVIGPVSKPFYVIRFTSNRNILEKSIYISMPVHFVPNMNYNDLTKYVLISQLKNMKGSDASWLHNNEPPENVREYSDDEEERLAQRQMKATRKHNQISNSTVNHHPGNHIKRGFKRNLRQSN